MHQALQNLYNYWPTRIVQGGRLVYIEIDFDNTGGLGGSVTSAALVQVRKIEKERGHNVYRGNQAGYSTTL